MFGMMSIRAFGDDTIYVAFPPNPYSTGGYRVPPDVDTWLTENKIDDWGVVNDIKAGVFMTGEDAVAFRLKFSL
jgi:hypothetical protein